MPSPAAGNVAPRRPLLPIWALVSLAWAGPAILAAFQSYAQGRIGARDPATWRALLWEGGDWLLYGFLTPGVFWCARRWPLRQGHLLRRLPIHLLAAIGFCALWAGGGLLLYHSLFGGSPYGGGRLSWFFTSLPFGVAVYFAVLAVEHATHYFVAARDRELQCKLIPAAPQRLIARVLRSEECAAHLVGVTPARLDFEAATGDRPHHR